MLKRGSATHLSIRTKIILMVVLTLFVAMSATAYFIRQLVTNNIVNQKITTTEILTTSILHDIKFDLDTHGANPGQEIVAKYMTYYRSITNMSIFDTSGVRTAASNPDRLHKLSDDPKVFEALRRAKPSLVVTRLDWNNLGIRSVAPILQGTHIIGALAIDVSVQDLQQTLAAMDRRIGLIMGIKVLLVSLVLFFLLRRSILLRLGRLITVTQQITAGNYDIQVDDSQHDEIGKLAEAFNRMTSDLQLSKGQIENYNKHLEERVRDATAQLQQAYEDLKSAQSQMVLNEKMASLGVLIAGVAHEINTPVGAILNVSRNLERRIRSLPEQIEAYRMTPGVGAEEWVSCLNDLIETSCAPHPPASYRTSRRIEDLLREHGVDAHQEKANVLCKLNFTAPDKIVRYIPCFRQPEFFAVAESFASMAQAATISESSSQKIAEIVRALKYYAYSGKDRVEPIQVNDSIQTALVLLRNQLKHSVDVVVALDPELPLIQCTSEIHQVWTNLLTNACDAIEARGDDGPSKITISSVRGAAGVVVRITDNGIGIPEDKIDKIFDPFFTTKDVGKGTGLGLCIASGIIKKHNGQIRVDSRPGRTVFEVTLPTTTATAAGLGGDEAQPSRPTDSPGAPAGTLPDSRAA